MNDRDAMARYRGEIERNRDAAERLCEKIHAKHGHCFLGRDCAFHAAFKKNRPFGCEVKGIGSVMGEKLPPGPCDIKLCPSQGDPVQEKITCTTPMIGCHYMIPHEGDDMHRGWFECGMEEAALAVAEEPSQKPHAWHPAVDVRQ